jgi:tetratricopeptide (TPR) repeat protein
MVAAALTAMAWWQSRWQLNASGAQICLALVVIGCWTISYRPLVRWVVVLAVICVLYVPTAVMRVVGTSRDIKARVISPRDASLALARDIAAALRASQPQGEIVMLASPNASTTIGYYGRFKTLGTLYWENTAGLKAAAAIYSAQSEEEAAKLIREHKVTHIAILTEENFIQQYSQLLHPKASADDIRKSFGFRLFYEKVVPQWLQMIPYKVPDDLSSLKMGVMLLKVNFNQTLIEAVYHVVETQLAQDQLEDADRTLDTLLKMAPQLSQAWLRKAELLLARHDWAKATEYFLKGIAFAPESDRPTLYENVAGALYKQGQHALAIRVYRAGIAERRVPNLVCFLGWILATSPNDSIRNGKEAFELAQEALKTDPNSPSYLNTLAAALAEMGRLPEAIDACDRAVASARVRGETAVAQAFEQRLAVLKSGRPLRN